MVVWRQWPALSTHQPPQRWGVRAARCGDAEGKEEERDGGEQPRAGAPIPRAPASSSVALPPGHVCPSFSVEQS